MIADLPEAVRAQRNRVKALYTSGKTAIGAHVKQRSRPLTGPQRSQPRIVTVPNHR